MSGCKEIILLYHKFHLKVLVVLEITSYRNAIIEQKALPQIHKMYEYSFHLLNFKIDRMFIISMFQDDAFYLASSYIDNWRQCVSIAKQRKSWLNTSFREQILAANGNLYMVLEGIVDCHGQCICYFIKFARFLENDDNISGSVYLSELREHIEFINRVVQNQRARPAVWKLQ